MQIIHDKPAEEKIDYLSGMAFLSVYVVIVAVMLAQLSSWVSEDGGKW